MPRRPRTRGRTFDARARLCAAKIHTPNINQRCPRSWASLTCLVGTLLARVRRRMTDVLRAKNSREGAGAPSASRRRFFLPRLRLFFSRTTLPRTAKTNSTSRASQVVRQIDHGAIRVADRDSPCPCAVSFYAPLLLTSLPATVLGRRAIGRDPLCPSVALRTSLCHAHRSRSQRVAMTGRRRGCFYIRSAFAFSAFTATARLCSFGASPNARETREGAAASGFRVFSVCSAARDDDGSVMRPVD